MGGATAILPPNSAKWRPPPTPTRPISAAARAALASAAALAERSGRGSSRKKTTAAAPAAPAAPAVIQINTLNSKFPIIGEAAKECGYEVVSDENMEADVFWFDVRKALPLKNMYQQQHHFNYLDILIQIAFFAFWFCFKLIGF